MTQEPKKQMSVEGLLGAGKSTLFMTVQERLTVPCLAEPVEDWRMLDDFYRDPAQHTFMLQAEILTSLKRWERHTSYVSERCAATSIQVFSKIHLDLGNLTQREFDGLQFYQEQHLGFPTHILYVDLSPEQALERIRRRQRPCEAGITLDYLRQIQAAYEAWFARTDLPVLVLNGDRSTQELADEFLQAITSIDPTLIREGGGTGKQKDGSYVILF